MARAGDGSAEAGYGYEYSFTFSGPSGEAFATSALLGSATPALEVVAVGSAGGCADLKGTTETVLAITADAKNNATQVATSQKVDGLLVPGDRVALSTAADARYARAATRAQRPHACNSCSLREPPRDKVGRLSSGQPASSTPWTK